MPLALAFSFSWRRRHSLPIDDLCRSQLAPWLFVSKLYSWRFGLIWIHKGITFNVYRDHNWCFYLCWQMSWFWSSRVRFLQDSHGNPFFQPVIAYRIHKVLQCSFVACSRRSLLVLVCEATRHSQTERSRLKAPPSGELGSKNFFSVPQSASASASRMDGPKPPFRFCAPGNGALPIATSHEPGEMIFFFRWIVGRWIFGLERAGPADTTCVSSRNGKKYGTKISWIASLGGSEISTNDGSVRWWLQFHFQFAFWGSNWSFSCFSFYYEWLRRSGRRLNWAHKFETDLA